MTLSRVLRLVSSSSRVPHDAGEVTTLLGGRLRLREPRLARGPLDALTHLVVVTTWGAGHHDLLHRLLLVLLLLALLERLLVILLPLRARVPLHDDRLAASVTPAGLVEVVVQVEGEAPDGGDDDVVAHCVAFLFSSSDLKDQA